jgi:hypothetical protein
MFRMTNLLGAEDFAGLSGFMEWFLGKLGDPGNHTRRFFEGEAARWAICSNSGKASL